MKTIGLIGGMSWESTLTYYQLVNQRVAQVRGGLHSAKILLHSFDFAEIEALQREDRWNQAGELLASAGCSLQVAGADVLVLCTNTMHRVAGMIEAAADVPLLHIADPTASAIQTDGFHTVGLLGTQFTMEHPFYRGRLETKHQLRVVIPNPAERSRVHTIIYEELCRGIISEPSRQEMLHVISDLQADGAQGIILGCTEIGLLVRPSDSSIPLYDTARLHAIAAADYAMNADKLRADF